MFTLLIYSAAGRRCETKRVQTLARISGRRCSEWLQPFETQVSREAQCHAASLLRSNPETTRFVNRQLKG